MINDILSKLKREIKILTGQITSFKKDVNYNYEWYGNKHGGLGFYVHPDVLTNKSIVYSFGIGEDISFDLAMVDKHGCKVFGFDPTPKSINWVKSQELPSNFTFLEYGIDVKTGFVDFHLPKNENHVSGSILMHKHIDSRIVSVPMKKFDDIVTNLKHTHIDVLKLDIEGSEYSVIDSILSSPVPIKQLLIEIHERFFDDGKTKTKGLLNSLKQNGYALFAVSKRFDQLSFIKVN